MSNASNLAEARTTLELLFTQHGISQFVSVDQLSTWCNAEHDNTDTSLLILFGLLPHDLNEKESDQFITATTNYLNLLPRDIHEGRSPIEASQEQHSPQWDSLSCDPSEWQNAYNTGTSLLKAERFREAREYYDKAAKALLHNRTTDREVCRLFANKGIVHLACGNPLEGELLLKLALKLNPHYKFAQQQLKRLEDGGFEPLIRSNMQEAFEAFQDPNHAMNRWDPDDIATLSTEDIVRKLNEYGIQTDQATFTKQSKKVGSAEMFADRYWYPDNTAPDLDQDFIWMAAEELWQRWTPDQPSIHKLSALLDTALEIPKKDRANILHDIAHVLDNAETPFFAAWEQFRDEHNGDLAMLTDVLLDAFAVSGYALWAVDTAKQLHKRTKYEPLKIVPVTSQLREKHPAWETAYDALRHNRKNIYQVYIPLACFASTHDHTLRQRFLADAFESIAKRISDKAYDLPDYQRTILEDGEWVVDTAAKFLRSHPDTKLQKRLDDLESILKKNSDELDHSPKEEKNIQKMHERIVDEFKKNDPAMRYYDWLETFNINFAHPIEENRIALKKVGRNDPCPCGSGRKFKKCCGK